MARRSLFERYRLRAAKKAYPKMQERWRRARAEDEATRRLENDDEDARARGTQDDA